MEEELNNTDFSPDEESNEEDETESANEDEEDESENASNPEPVPEEGLDTMDSTVSPHPPPQNVSISSVEAPHAETEGAESPMEVEREPRNVPAPSAPANGQGRARGGGARRGRRMRRSRDHAHELLRQIEGYFYI